MGLRDKEQLAHQQLQLCTQSGFISWVSAPFKEPRTPPPQKLLYLSIIPLSSILFLCYRKTPVIAFCVNYYLSQDLYLQPIFFLHLKKKGGGGGKGRGEYRNQMTTVDTLKFPVNRFIIAASSVWKYKQFPHLIIGRIWGSLTLPRQRIRCATAELCSVACILCFLLFAFSRSPRLFPETIKVILSSKIDTCV